MNDDTLYRIALMLCKGMTCKHYRHLVENCGSASRVFEQDELTLLHLMGSRAVSAVGCIMDKSTLDAAAKELDFTEKNGIRVLHFQDPDYPQRLNDAGCEDTPPLLYYKGHADLNRKHIVSIVGTRKATNYGKVEAMRIVEQMSGIEDLLVVSGLAYGIDSIAHRTCTELGIETVGVLGHGFKTLYPPENRQLARTMCDGNGGLLTEYTSDTGISRNQFPARNRIIAAMSDVTIVVEAAERGGALITAGMAMGYHRDVMAVPGRNDDSMSCGCNNLIAAGHARMLRSASDLEEWMGWAVRRPEEPPLPYDTQPIEGLTKEESGIIEVLKSAPELTMDEIVEKTNYSIPKTATAILSLELKKHIICLAGKKYKII